MSLCRPLSLERSPITSALFVPSLYNLNTNIDRWKTPFIGLLFIRFTELEPPDASTVQVKELAKFVLLPQSAEDAVNSIDWVAISVELIRRGTIRKWRRNETVYRRRWIWPLLIIVESNFGLLLQRRRGVKCDKKRLRIRSCSRLQLPRRSVGTQLSWYVDFSFFVLWILRPERAERIRGGLLFLLLFCSLPLLFWHGSDLHAALIAALATVTRQITNGFSWPYFIFLFKCQVLVTLKDFLANSLATH